MLSDDLVKYDELGVDMNSYVINIFDFDGTIYESPVPNADRLGNKFAGRLNSTIAEKGLGWFQNPITLQPKYTTELGDFFNYDVIADIRKSMAEPNHKTIMKTGRTTAYTSYIMGIIDTLEEPVVFDEYILKPTPEKGYNESTGAFKCRVLGELIEKYNATELNIWEDRVKHVQLFNDFIANHPQLSDGVVHHIESHPNNLPSALEDEIISILKGQNNLHESAKSMTIPKPLYYGIVLDNESRYKLISSYNIPDGWKTIAHHMTIIFGDKERDVLVSRYIDSHIGMNVAFNATHIGVSDDAIAVKVNPGAVPCVNKTPHITLAIPQGGKAVNSNNIQAWSVLETPIYLNGIITALYR